MDVNLVKIITARKENIRKGGFLSMWLQAKLLEREGIISADYPDVFFLADLFLFLYFFFLYKGEH